MCFNIIWVYWVLIYRVFKFIWLKFNLMLDVFLNWMLKYWWEKLSNNKIFKWLVVLYVGFCM